MNTISFERYAPCVLIVEGNYFTVDDGNSYYDTQFATIEECEQWGQEHGCNGYYDTISDTFQLFDSTINCKYDSEF